MIRAGQALAERGLQALLVGCWFAAIGLAVHGDRPHHRDEPWIPIAFAASGIILGALIRRGRLLPVAAILQGLLSVLFLYVLLVMRGTGDWITGVQIGALLHAAVCQFVYVERRRPVLLTVAAGMVFVALASFALSEQKEGALLWVLPYTLTAVLAWLAPPGARKECR